MSGGKSPTYRAWQSMKQRCLNPRCHNYRLYGGRGITICDRWVNSFENFLADLGERPGDGYSLDRIDVNGDYEPGNCRWANKVEQARNRRDSAYVEIEGVPYLVMELAEKSGRLRTDIVYRASKGMTYEEVMRPTRYVADNAQKHRIWEKNVARMKALTHCKRGHEFNETNTYINPLGRRVCRVCDRLRGQRH